MMEEQAQYATYLPSGSNPPQLVSSPPPLLTPPPAPFPPLPTPTSTSGHNPTHLHHVTSTRTNASRRHSSRRSSHTPSHRSSSPPPGGHQASHSISGMGSILPEHIPTVGLLNSLPGAAHYSGQAASASRRESVKATFTGGADRVRLDPAREEILQDTLALFCGHATADIFQKHWRKDATFEDPLSKCYGYREIAAQWFALAKMVSSSTTLSHRVLASTTSPNRIVYSQRQEYVFKAFKYKKVVQSMVAIHLDSEGKISRLEDKWSGDDPPTKWGLLFLRRLNAKALPLFVSIPKYDGSTELHSVGHRPESAPPTNPSVIVTTYPPPPRTSL